MIWYEILNEVSNAKGKEKQAVLEKYKNDATLRKVLHFLYSPRIVTGISKKKIDKFELEDEATIYPSDDPNELVLKIMKYLKRHNTGKDEDIYFLIRELNSVVKDMELEYLRSLITKDMPIGISATTINKVFPKLIPQFKLQKGKLFEGEINGMQMVSLKLDGNSATVFNLEDETYILSRSGAIMNGFDHIISFYREKMPKGYVYQGELIAKNYHKMGHGELFRYSNGITNSKKDGEKGNLQHVIFDVILYEDFEKGKSNEPYVSRISIAQTVLSNYDPYGDSFEDVQVVPFYKITDNVDEIMTIANEKIKENLEGLMLCKADSIYKVGPQKWLQKVKEFNTADVLVKGITKHVRGNMVGALVVDWKGFEVGVSGLKDKDREEWWKDPNKIVGKVVEIKYFRETQDKNGKLSVRFPSFIRIREDKTFEEVSYE